jgi:hypothetical protein
LKHCSSRSKHYHEHNFGRYDIPTTATFSCVAPMRLSSRSRPRLRRRPRGTPLAEARIRWFVSIIGRFARHPRAPILASLR